MTDCSVCGRTLDATETGDTLHQNVEKLPGSSRISNVCAACALKYHFNRVERS